MTDNKKVVYKILSKNDSGWFTTKINFGELEEDLNRLGHEGWDLVTSLDINEYQGGTKKVALILKKYIS